MLGDTVAVSQLSLPSRVEIKVRVLLGGRDSCWGMYGEQWEYGEPYIVGLVWFCMLPLHDARNSGRSTGAARSGAGSDSATCCRDSWGWGWPCKLQSCVVRDLGRSSVLWGQVQLALHAAATCGQALRQESYGTAWAWTCTLPPHAAKHSGRSSVGPGRAGLMLCYHVRLGTWVGVLWVWVGLALHTAATCG